jgi:hypothetical protein
MELAGAIEVDPPFRGMEQEHVFGVGWSPSGDGRHVLPRAEVSLDAAVRALRELVAAEQGRRRYDGVVAAYDPDTRGLVVIAVHEGRVSRRTVRRPPVQERSNVIDLATHRRWISRAIS